MGKQAFARQRELGVLIYRGFILIDVCFKLTAANSNLIKIVRIIKSKITDEFIKGLRIKS